MSDGKNRPAVFLDRDGVLVEERGYTASKEEMKLFPYAAECIRQIHAKGYYAVVITNQSGVARGLFTEEDLRGMNEFLIRNTGVDAVYYCPHHPDGRIAEYRRTCSCRKPGTGLFEAAERDLEIDMKGSFMVGDRSSDIRAGQQAGVRTVLLESGYGTADPEEKAAPDYRFKDLRNVIEIL